MTWFLMVGWVGSWALKQHWPVNISDIDIQSVWTSSIVGADRGFVERNQGDSMYQHLTIVGNLGGDPELRVRR